MTDNKAAEAMERVSNWLERGRHGAPAPGRSDLRTLLTLAQPVDQGMMGEVRYLRRLYLLQTHEA